jgi:hypothetical protein
VAFGVVLVESNYYDNGLQNAAVQTPLSSPRGALSFTRANDPCGSFTKTFTESTNDFSPAEVLLASSIPSSDDERGSIIALV